MKVDVAAPTVIGPGLCDWGHAQAVLTGEAVSESGAVELPVVSLLSPRERRRVTATIRLALALGEICTGRLDGEARAALPSVFASMAGDLDVADRICTALAEPEPAVSPTQFHNSVHNAAAGYWAIAVGSQAPSTSVAAGAATAAVGLLEAAAQCATEGQPVLLVLYDGTPPAALAPPLGYDEPFGMGLLVMPTGFERTDPVWRLDLELGEAPETAMAEPWESVRLGNSAARALPLLQAMAHGGGRVALPGAAGRQLLVEVDYAH